MTSHRTMYSRSESTLTRAFAMGNLFSRIGLVCLLLGATILSARAGSIVRLIYDGIPGGAVIDLTSSPLFPGAPSRTETLNTLLEGVSDDGDNFGSFIRGYIEAPQTGYYLFWIASDEDSELWLSMDISPAGRQRIARNTGAVGPREW